MPKVSEEKLRAIYEVFKIAIESEKQAQKMYQKALERSFTEDQKKLFAWLLKEERMHEKRLVNKYASLRKKYLFKEEKDAS